MKMIFCTLCSAALAVAVSVSCNFNAVAAEADSTGASYTKLIEMSDQAVAESFRQRYSQYFEHGFGDGSVNDEEKFSALLTVEDNSWRERFLSGDKIPYFDLAVSENVPLDASLTADALGYPADWRMELYEGETWGDETSGYWEHKAHAYRVYCPVAVFEDYELYVRMQIAGEALANNENEFVVYNDPFGVRTPLSGEPVQGTTTTTTTTTTTETTTTPAGGVSTGDANMIYLLLAGAGAAAVAFFTKKRVRTSA